MLLILGQTIETVTCLGGRFQIFYLAFAEKYSNAAVPANRRYAFNGPRDKLLYGK